VLRRQPHDLRGAAADVNRNDASAERIHQRRAPMAPVRPGSGRQFPGRGQPPSSIPVAEIPAFNRPAARLGGNQAGAAGAAIEHLVATDRTAPRSRAAICGLAEAARRPHALCRAG